MSGSRASRRRRRLAGGGGAPFFSPSPSAPEAQGRSATHDALWFSITQW